ncbi:Dyp-type peroxidase [Gordonia sinesedis]
MAGVSTPQTIITRKTRAAVFIVMVINEGGEDAVRDMLADFPSRHNSVASRDPEAALSGIVSIGSDAWDRLFTGPRPRELRPFTPYVGEVHTAPATPGDILLHIKSDRMDMCYELGRLAMEMVGDAVTVVDETHGFRYWDLRDLIGFVDGTENPVGPAAVETITVTDDDPVFAGGSYVAIQRYITDLAAWDAITVAEQEAAIGRTKMDNVEFPDDVKPSNSHIALNVVENAQGEQIDVLRDNMPYGDAAGTGDRGTFYIAYSASPDVTEEMLRKMFIGDPPGNYDRLLDFTTAVTGAQFYAPTIDFLEDLPPAPGAVQATDTDAPSTDTARDTESEPAHPTAPPTGRGDGSLGIGSLH